MNKERMIIKPINLIIEKLKNAQHNGVFLLGEAGSGKTATLLTYIEQSKKTNTPVIDITLTSISSLNLTKELAKLFQVCIILQKMLLYLKENYLKSYFEHFLLFNTKILNITKDIINMYNLNNYSLKDSIITNDILNNPEILLQEFMNLVNTHLNITKLTVILDNFDIEKMDMQLYQTDIYSMLKKYMQVVATISDSKVINNSDKLKSLSKDNTLIKVDYNREVSIVKRILDKSLLTEPYKNVIGKSVSFTFKDDTIAKLINKTNGNLNLMLLAVKMFFARTSEIPSLEYENTLLSIVDECMYLKAFLLNSEKVRKLII